MTTPKTPSTPKPAISLFKVLKNGASCNGGNQVWDLPKNGKPGKWLKHTGALQLCQTGYHLTRWPAVWWQEGCSVFLAETKGELIGDLVHGEKVAARQVRLIKELTGAELAQGLVFTEGEHRIGDGIARAYGNAKVTADGNAKVTAYGNAKVTADGNAKVTAYGNAKVTADGNAKVTADGNAEVTAYGNAEVTADGNAEVTAYGNAKVTAYGNAKVTAQRESIVERRWYHTGDVTVFERAVIVDRRSGAFTVLTAAGELAPKPKAVA